MPLSIGILVIDFAVMSSTGFGEAVELEEKESTVARIWRYFAYAWTAGRNILVLWLVYLAFGKNGVSLPKTHVGRSGSDSSER